MNRQSLKLAVVMCCAVLGLLYVVDWVTQAAKKRVMTNAPVSVGVPTNAMSLSVRAGIATALEHVRYEIAHTTNVTDLQVLKAAEASLTNVLARP